MGTMNISLPDQLKAFVEEQVAQRGYGTSSEYIRELIRKDQDRATLRGLILEGAASAPGGPADDAYFDRLRACPRPTTPHRMTNKPVIPRDLANQDVEHAIDHYLDEEAAQAASDLIDALRTAYRLIGLRPGIGSPRYSDELDIPGLRGRPLKHFSYIVVYVERTGHHIDVLRVLHQRRDIPELLRNLDQDEHPTQSAAP